MNPLALCRRLLATGYIWEQCTAPATLIAQGHNPPKEVAGTRWAPHGITTDPWDLQLEWATCLGHAPTTAVPIGAWRERLTDDPAAWCALAVTRRAEED